jgi:PAS domain S-box-containing protein
MPTQTETRKRPSPDSELSLLRRAFEQFESNSRRLEQAYSKMQEDFSRLNLELDSKNEELKRTLDETRTTREHLNSILQTLKSGVIVVDTKARITHFNRAAEMTGIKQQDAIGQEYERVVPQAKESGNALETLRTGREFHNEDGLLRTRHGSFIPVNSSTAVVKDGRGEVLGAMEVFQDISNIKAMEQEILQARTLSALGEMSATVAHEIRNPLGGIGTYAALLERDLDKDDPRRNLVRSIMQGIASLNKIVTNLLVYTRPLRGTLQRIALNDFVRQVADFAALEIPEQQKPAVVVQTRVGSRILHSRIDPEKIQQLFLNLFFNAVQAMPDGGRVTVCLKSTSKPPSGGRKSGAETWNCLVIEDTGKGIPVENLTKIFNPFFTTKENGTGLGLAIVRRIAEFHKGVLNVKSRLGRGTTVELYLPSS